MDESLLDDDSITIDNIIQAPKGSVLSQKTPVIPIKKDDLE